MTRRSLSLLLQLTLLTITTLSSFQGTLAATLLGVGSLSSGFDTKGASFDVVKEEGSLTKITGKGVALEVDHVDFRMGGGTLSFTPGYIEYKKNEAKWTSTIYEERREEKRNDVLLLQQTASDRLNRYEWVFNGSAFFRDITLDYSPSSFNSKNNEKDKPPGLTSKILMNFCTADRKSAGRDTAVCGKPEFYSTQYSLLQLLEYISKIYLQNMEQTLASTEKLTEQAKKGVSQSDSSQQKSTATVSEEQFKQLASSSQTLSLQLKTLDDSFQQFRQVSQTTSDRQEEAVKALTTSLRDTREQVERQLQEVRTALQQTLAADLAALGQSLAAAHGNVSALSILLEQLRTDEEKLRSDLPELVNRALTFALPALLAEEAARANETVAAGRREDQELVRAQFMLAIEGWDRSLRGNLSALETERIAPLENRLTLSLEQTVSQLNGTLSTWQSDLERRLFDEAVAGLEETLRLVGEEIRATNTSHSESLGEQRRRLDDWRAETNQSLQLLKERADEKVLSLSQNISQLLSHDLPGALAGLRGELEQRITDGRNFSSEIANNISLAIAHSNSIFAKVIHEVNQTHHSRLDDFQQTLFLPFRADTLANLSETRTTLQEQLELQAREVHRDLNRLQEENAQNHSQLVALLQQRIAQTAADWNNSLQSSEAQTRELFQYYSNQQTFLKSWIANISLDFEVRLQSLGSQANESLATLEKNLADRLLEANQTLSQRQDHLEQRWRSTLEEDRRAIAANFSGQQEQQNTLAQRLIDIDEKQSQALLRVNETARKSLDDEVSRRDLLLRTLEDRLVLRTALLNVSLAEDQRRVDQRFELSHRDHLALSAHVNDSYAALNQTILSIGANASQSLASLGESLRSDWTVKLADAAADTRTEFGRFNRSLQELAVGANQSLAALGEQLRLESSQLAAGWSARVDLLNSSLLTWRDLSHSQLQKAVAELNDSSLRGQQALSATVSALNVSTARNDELLRSRSDQLTEQLAALSQLAQRNHSQLALALAAQNESQVRRFENFYEKEFQTNVSQLQRWLTEEKQNNSRQVSLLQQQLLETQATQKQAEAATNQSIAAAASRLQSQIDKTNELLISVQVESQHQLERSVKELAQDFRASQTNQSNQLLSFAKDTAQKQASSERHWNATFLAFSADFQRNRTDFVRETDVFQQEVREKIQQLSQAQQLFQQGLQQNLSHSLEKQSLVLQKNEQVLAQQIQQLRERTDQAADRQEKWNAETKAEHLRQFAALEGEKFPAVQKDLAEFQKKLSGLQDGVALSTAQLTASQEKQQRLQQELEASREKSSGLATQVDRLARDWQANQTITAFQFAHLSAEVAKLSGAQQNQSSAAGQSLKLLERELHEIQRNLSLAALQHQQLDRTVHSLETKLSGDIAAKQTSLELKQQETALQLAAISAHAQQWRDKDVDGRLKEAAGQCAAAQEKTKEVAAALQSFQNTAEALAKRSGESTQQQIDQLGSRLQDLDKRYFQLENGNKLNEKLLDLLTKQGAAGATGASPSTVLPGTPAGNAASPIAASRKDKSSEQGQASAAASLEQKLLEMYEKEHSKLSQLVERQQKEIEQLVRENKQLKEQFVSKDDYKQLASKVETMQSQLVGQLIQLLNRKN